MSRRAFLLVAASIALLAAPVSAWTERLEIERRVTSLVATDRTERALAARRLGVVGDQDRAVLALIDALVAEQEPAVRTAIADGLARRRDARAIDALAASRPHMDAAERDARLRALAAIDAPEARHALAVALGGDGGERALQHVIELGPLMIDELLPLLGETLPSRDAAAAAPRAARALGAIGDRRGADALIARAAADDLGLRAAVLEAIGAIGDERAVPALLEQIGADDPNVAIQALRAIARLGSQTESDAVLAQVRSDDAEVSATALQALAMLDPARARALLEGALASDGPQRAATWDAIVAVPDQAFVPLFVAESQHEARRAEAADALARIDQGGGVPALIEMAGAHGRDAHVALARALRRWRGITSEVRTHGLAALAAERAPERSLLLRAIARDDNALNELVTRLRDPDANIRGAVARALAILRPNDDRARSALREAIAIERDPITLEVMARAQDELGGTADAPNLDERDDPARRDALLVVASIARPAGSPRLRRELRTALLAALRAPSPPRARALAAFALGRRGDREARIALLAALEDDASEVRLAAARALDVLHAANDEPSLAARLASRLAIEPHAMVRRALRDALDEADGSSAIRGDECLHVRLDHLGVTEVELWLPDGRWLRERTLATGEIVVCDLPTADVDVRLAPRGAAPDRR